MLKLKSTIAVVVFSVAVPLNAATQLSSGTIVDVQWNPDEIVIAADSRQIVGNSYSDTACKISILGKKMVFAASGIIQGFGRDNWEGHAIAKEEFERVTQKHRPKGLVIEVAESWGAAVTMQLEKSGSAVFDGQEDNHITDGLFAGFDASGALSIAITDISYETSASGQKTITSSTQAIAQTTGARFLGRGEIENELAAQKTARSIQWLKDLRAALNTAENPTVTGSVKKVQLTIDNLPKKKTDAYGRAFSSVAPPIAVVQWKRGKAAEWVQPGKCPASQ